MYYIGSVQCNPNYLQHYGILGMKWGIRRYQNEDRSLTEAGKLRYLGNNNSLTDQGKREFFKNESSTLSRKGEKAIDTFGKDSDIGKAIRSERFGRNYSKNWTKSYNKAVDVLNSKTDEINKRHENDSTPEDRKKYFEELGNVWKTAYEGYLLEDFGEHPTMGKEWVTMAFGYGQFDDIPEDW